MNLANLEIMFELVDVLKLELSILDMEMRQNTPTKMSLRLYDEYIYGPS